jgi:hypothetical protein
VIPSPVHHVRQHEHIGLGNLLVSKVLQDRDKVQ